MSIQSIACGLFKVSVLALSIACLNACGGGGGSGGDAVLTGIASLSWEAPITNGDGAPLALSEIAGYRVYAGTASNNLSVVADINDGSVTTHTVTGLPSGINYFAVTAYNYSNNESRRSNVASKTVP